MELGQNQAAFYLSLCLGNDRGRDQADLLCVTRYRNCLDDGLSGGVSDNGTSGVVYHLHKICYNFGYRFTENFALTHEQDMFMDSQGYPRLYQSHRLLLILFKG